MGHRKGVQPIEVLPETSSARVIARDVIRQFVLNMPQQEFLHSNGHT
jgi:hypothetical protein